MGRIEGSERNLFELTVLALKYSLRSNGVSLLHGIVSRYMWQENWKGVPAPEIPIGHVTNGIHVPSYVGAEMKSLLTRHLEEGWMDLPPDSPQWDRIAEISDKQLWEAKQSQKVILLDKIRSSLPEFFKKFNIPHDAGKAMMANISPSALVIGFARRFAPYKRASLLFADPERLVRILSDSTQPVLFVFAGKAHPADVQGIDILQEVIKFACDPRF